MTRVILVSEPTTLNHRFTWSVWAGDDPRTARLRGEADTFDGAWAAARAACDGLPADDADVLAWLGEPVLANGVTTAEG